MHNLLQSLEAFRDNPEDEVIKDRAVGHLEKYLDPLHEILSSGLFWRVGVFPSSSFSALLKAFYLSQELPKKESKK